MDLAPRWLSFAAWYGCRRRPGLTRWTDVRNASLVEEAAAAAKSLQDQAGDLAQVVTCSSLDGTNTVAVAMRSAVTHKAAMVAMGASKP
jgi:hypothetical protein